MSSVAGTATSYDEVPYISVAIPPSHPDRMATVARLFGLPAPDTQSARVLELGCASGGNLLPMAETLPGGTFVGVDFSNRQVQTGRQTISAAGLTNVNLEHQDILNVGPELGQFDYIIVHGVYSWVPDAVRQKIFQLCRELLTEYGVAYISYNTYPGWRFHEVLRDMLLYRTRNLADPRAKVRQSRILLEELSKTIPQTEQATGAILRAHLDALRKLADPFLLHDHLEAVNEPMYFHEFISAAEPAGLRFLGEAIMGEMYTGRFSPQVQQSLNQLATGVVDLEQYIDFFSNRMLRRTLLCKQETGIDRRLSADRARALYFAADVKPETTDFDVQSSAPVAFQSTSGFSVTSGEPIMKAALVHLGKAWPRSIQFEELLSTVGSQVDASAATVKSNHAEVLGGGLLHGAAGGMIDVRTHVPSLVTEVSERPQVSPLARAQAQASNLVTNRRHDVVSLNDLSRFVVSRADGTQTVEDLAKALLAAVEEGRMKIAPTGEESMRGNDREQLVQQAVGQSLADAARSALLIA